MNKNNKNEIHFFEKIRTNYLIQLILSFLSISDAKKSVLINKRFKKILLDDNQQLLKEIGELTYGFDKFQTFNSNNNLSKYKIDSFPFFQLPILKMLQVNNLIIVSPETFENGIFIYSLENFRMIHKIYHRDLYGNNTFLYAMSYSKEKDNFIFSFSDLTLSNYSNHFYLNWNIKIGVEKPINFISCINDYIFTCESHEKIGLNFIKEYNINNGNHINTFVLKFLSIFNMKIFEISKLEIKYLSNEIKEKEPFLVFSLYDYTNLNENTNFYFDLKSKSTRLSLSSISNLNNLKYSYDILNKSNYEIIKFDVNFFGHNAIIKDYIYIESKNFIISVGVDLYIFIWDIINKNAKIFIDSLHTDIIYSLSNINDNLFCTCGKDRKIFIYSINSILLNDNNNYSEINCNHTSDIYNIFSYNNIIISGSFDKTMKLFYMSNDYKKVENKIILTGHYSSITVCKFDYVHNILLTIGLDNIINIWKIKKETNEFQIIKSIEFFIEKGKKEFIDDAIILFDENLTFVKIDNSKEIKFYSLKDGKNYQSIKTNSIIRSIMDIYDGIHFICGLSNGKINLYSYKNIGNIKEINLKRELLHCEEEKNNLKIKLLTYFVYQDKIFASGANDGSVNIFFLNNKKKIYIKTKYDKKEISNIINLKYNKEKSILLIGISIDKNLLIYDGIQNKFLKEISFGINYGKILSIDNLNENLFMISHQFIDDILIIDKTNYQEKSKIKIEKGLIKKVFYLRDGYSIASLTGTGSQNNMGLNIIKFS